MPAHFGGISPIKNQQRAKTLVLGLAAVFVVCLAIVGFLVVNSGPSTATQNSSANQGVATQVESVQVLIPIQNIETGSRLDEAMFRKEMRPKAGLSPRAVRDFEEVKNHWARTLIPADSPLVQDVITIVQPVHAVTAMIPDGYRAVTIKVDSTSSVEGWARPGAKVDVYWATSLNSKQTVKVIVENAQVLSVEQSLQSAPPGSQGQQPNKDGGMAIPRTATLLVSARDAQKIQLAQTAGTLSLSLRGDTDSGKAGDSQAITMADLFGGQTKEAVDTPSEGTVRIGDVEYNVINGKMVPVTKK
jgi:pilus assembly protein CpaB